MKLYHSTNADAADLIDAVGFRDSASVHPELVGVWFADEPGAYGAEVFEIEIDAVLARRYFLDYDDADAPREWCIPAAVANTLPRRRQA